MTESSEGCAGGESKRHRAEWRVERGKGKGQEAGATTMTMSKLIRRNHIKTSTRIRKQGARTQDSFKLSSDEAFGWVKDETYCAQTPAKRTNRTSTHQYTRTPPPTQTTCLVLSVSVQVDDGGWIRDFGILADRQTRTHTHTHTHTQTSVVHTQSGAIPTTPFASVCVPVGMYLFPIYSVSVCPHRLE